MIRSCSLTYAPASPIGCTVSTTISPSRFRGCKLQCSAAQQDVQLRLEQPGTIEDVRPGSQEGYFDNYELRCSDGAFRPSASGAVQDGGIRKVAEISNLDQLNDIVGSITDGESGSDDTPVEPAFDEENDAEIPLDDEPFEPITKISVPRQKYIPVPKVSLVRALVNSFDNEKRKSEFLMICSLLDFILHAEHKTILEQMRLDYRITRSALKKRRESSKKISYEQNKSRNNENMLKKLWHFLRRRKESSNSTSNQLADSFQSQANDLIVPSDLGSPSLNKENLGQGMHSSLVNNGGAFTRDSGVSSRSNISASLDDTVRNSAMAAARFQRTFLKLLKNAQFQGLSTRDLQLTSALNTDYLLTLPIEVDWKYTSSAVAIIFRRGYASERQEGLLFGAKLDYLQSLLLRKIFNWFSKPLFRGGRWINQQLKRSKRSNGSKSWTEEFAEWLKEPLKPQTDDDAPDLLAESLTDEEKVNYFPIWIAAQQAVPRYEAFLSSVGSRGMLLRKILMWMRILPASAAKLPLDSIMDARSLDSPLRGSNIARISMRDIWAPASKMVCGNNLWKQLRAAISVFFSRSTLQEPAYKELVLLYNVPSTDNDDKEYKIPELQLKIYGKIPIPDLKVTLRRWTWMHRPIHGFAGLLHTDIEVLSDRLSYMSRVVPSHLHNEMLEQISCYLDERGNSAFTFPSCWHRASMVKPLFWWQNFGFSFSTLSTYALRLLSQDCSSGACERNWSAFSLIHTKVRNRLSPEQMEKLIYCRTNLRMLENIPNMETLKQVDVDTFWPLLSTMPRPGDEMHEDDEDFLFAELYRELSSIDVRQTRSRTSTSRGIRVVRGCGKGLIIRRGSSSTSMHGEEAGTSRAPLHTATYMRRTILPARHHSSQFDDEGNVISPIESPVSSTYEMTSEDSLDEPDDSDDDIE